MNPRLFILLLALDHLILAIGTFGNCRRGEYISSAAWSLEMQGKWQGRLWRPVIDWIFLTIGGVPHHCRDSWRGQKFLYPEAQQ
jgi:hypothetical protein